MTARPAARRTAKRRALVSIPPPAPAALNRLLKAARAVRRRAFAPYSGFHVGAALLDQSGRIHVGCNVENASYGLTVCAERNAVSAAVAEGARSIRAIAVISNVVPAVSPCGACRQVLVEFGSADTTVLLAGLRGPAVAHRLGALLPESFSLRSRRPI